MIDVYHISTVAIIFSICSFYINRPHEVKIIPEDYILAILAPMYQTLSSALGVVLSCIQGNTMVFFPEYNFLKLVTGIEKYKVNI